MGKSLVCAETGSSSQTGRPSLIESGRGRWQEYVAGTGVVESSVEALRLVVSDVSSSQYSDAQIDDYQGLTRREFHWHPPLRMTVNARFSHPAGVLRGTAGFGFWNDPFMMTGKRPPTLPRAVWFFYSSPPSNLKLARDVPGDGWKAATIDALAPRALAWVPVAPLGVLLMNARPLYRRLWPQIQRSLCIREAAIETDMTDWHTYCLEWRESGVSFSVDGVLLLDGSPAPRGPLGFVAWVDNQYMIATPWGRFGWGLLETPGRQWLEIAGLTLDPL